MRVEVEDLVENLGGNESIFAFFRLAFYEGDSQKAFVIVNGCMIVPDSAPMEDGSQRLAVKFPFLNKSFQPDQIKHLLYFVEGEVKKNIIIDALAQYRAQFGEAVID